MTCKNCSHALSKVDNYCNHCGGKVIRNRLTLKNLFASLSFEFFNYDNKLLQTIIGLFTKPEDVIGGYIRGVRKRYINPISLFAIGLSLSGLLLFLIQKYFPEALDYSNLLNNSALNNPQSIALMEKTTGITTEYNSLIFSLLIPGFALLSLITFFNQKYIYTEHVIIYLYTFSLFSIISVIIGCFVLVIDSSYYFKTGLILYSLTFLFNAYVLKRIFNLSVKVIVLKTLFFLILFFVAYFVFSILLTLFLLGIGIIDLQDLTSSKS